MLNFCCVSFVSYCAHRFGRNKASWGAMSIVNLFVRSAGILLTFCWLRYLPVFLALLMINFDYGIEGDCTLRSSLSEISAQFRQPQIQQASKCSAVTNGPLARMCALPNAILISRLSSTYYRRTLMGRMFKISLRKSTLRDLVFTYQAVHQACNDTKWRKCILISLRKMHAKLNLANSCSSSNAIFATLEIIIYAI